VFLDQGPALLAECGFDQPHALAANFLPPSE